MEGKHINPKSWQNKVKTNKPAVVEVNDEILIQSILLQKAISQKEKWRLMDVVYSLSENRLINLFKSEKHCELCLPDTETECINEYCECHLATNSNK